jgi:TPR repeat protein
VVKEDLGLLVYEGKRLCFGDEARDVEKGRELLQRASEEGRDDATFYLGRSFEADGLYEQAAEIYKSALQKQYRVAIYRLALLHGRGQLSYSDRGYYLKTIKRLALDGHHPSIALYTKERIKGAYGLFAFVTGIFAVVPNFLRATYAAYKDPNDSLLQR